MFDERQVRRGIRFLKTSDPVMDHVIQEIGPFRLKAQRRGFEILVRSILSQQISTSAARTIRERLQDLLPGRRIRPAALEALTDEQLQSVGISIQKRSSLRDLTRHALDGTLNFRRIARVRDEEAIEELIQVRGIGRWTAQMYLIFSLGRMDVFAPDDLGLQQAIRKLYVLPQSPKRAHFDELAVRWSPYRSIASWYLWRYLEMARAQQRSAD